MIKALLLILLSLTCYADLTTPPKSTEQQYIPWRNVLKNPGFELGKTSFTLSTGTWSTSITTPQEGAKKALWDAAAAAATFSTETFTILDGYKGQSGVCAVWIKASSGTATHTLEAYDGTNILSTTTVTSSTSVWTLNVTNFIFPTSGSVRCRLQSQANEPEIGMDGWALGLAQGFNVGTGISITEWTSWTPTGTWSTNTTYTGYKRRVGDTAEYYVKVSVAGAPTSATLTINLPPDEVINSTKLGSPAGDENVLGTGGILDSGTATYTGLVLYNNTTSVAVAYADSAAAATAFAAVITQAAPMTWASGDSAWFQFKVPIVGFASGQTYTSDQLSWQVIADITGANPSLGISAVAAYTEIIDAGLTMTPVAGSQPVGIMCSTTNAATAPSTGATTCAAGSESVGGNFNIPWAGWYEVCFQYAHSIVVDSAENVSATFNVIQTPLAAQTLTYEGGPRTQSAYTGLNIATGVDAVASFSHNDCGQINFATAGNVGVRLMYEQSVAGSPDASAIAADAGANNGQRAIHMTVRPIIANRPTPLLVNSVVSGYSGVSRVEWVKFSDTSTPATQCNQDPCVIIRQSGGISSVGRTSTGLYTINFSPAWAEAPSCTFNSDSTAAILTGIETSAPSVTQWLLSLYNSTPVVTDGSGTVTCVGKK